MKKTKVIFITREGYDLPGARIRCHNFARELNKYGLEAEVFSFSDTMGAKDGKNEWRMPFVKKIGYNLRAFRMLRKEKDAVFIMQRFHYHSFGPYLAHLCARNKFIFDLDDWEIRENPKYYFGFLPSSKAEFLTRQLAGRSNICIAASKYLQSYLSRFNKYVYYLPSGVDTDLFKPLNGRRNTDDPKIVFSWVGTIHSSDILENLKFISDCFLSLRKQFSNVYLEIGGDGKYLNEFIEVLRAREDNHIIYKGWINPRAVPEYLASIDIGLVPLVQDSRFNKAKSPVKLFEYMAMGKPTVSTSIGEIKHIIQDGKNGLLADTKADFIKRMERLVLDKELRESMGKNARRTIEDNYSLNILGHELCKIVLSKSAKE